LARSSGILTHQLAIALVALGFALSAAGAARADAMGGGPVMGPMSPGGSGPPVYQRQGSWNGPGGPGFGGPGFGGPPMGNRGGYGGGGYGFAPAQFSGSYFTRPYPYHLDYYKMRYGGSYAPYYGNLYGPSNSYYPAQYNGDNGPNYTNGNQNYPQQGYAPDGAASGDGHWAWCWVPSTGVGPNTTEPVDQSALLPGRAVEQPSATTTYSQPAGGSTSAPALTPAH
jgi:hypothetical protein